jgi:hypothetical protein
MTFPLGAHAEATSAPNSRRAKMKERIRDMYNPQKIDGPQIKARRVADPDE